MSQYFLYHRVINPKWFSDALLEACGYAVTVKTIGTVACMSFIIIFTTPECTQDEWLDILPVCVCLLSKTCSFSLSSDVIKGRPLTVFTGPKYKNRIF